MTEYRLFRCWPCKALVHQSFPACPHCGGQLDSSAFRTIQVRKEATR